MFSNTEVFDTLQAQTMLKYRLVEIYNSTTCLLKSLIDVFPVGNVPNGFNVIRANILILKIICMFPDINSKQWNQT